MPHPFFPLPMFAWIFFLSLAGVTAVAAVVDLRTLTIPKWITLPTLVLGVLFSMARSAWLGAWGLGAVLNFEASGPWLGCLDGLVTAVLGALFGFGLFTVMWLLGTCSGGDVKLFTALGAWCGVTLTLFLLMGTVVFVVLLAVARLSWGMLTGGGRNTAKDFSVAAAPGQGRPAGTQGARGARRPRRRLTAYSLPVTLSVLVVFPWLFRGELNLDKMVHPQPEIGYPDRSVPGAEGEDSP